MDIIEDDNRVNLVEAARERVVATVVEVLAADEAQAGRVAVDGKGEGVPLSTVEGKTSNSSAIGPIVASIRAPRITMPLSSSRTT